MRRSDLALEIIVVDGIQQRIACQIITGRDESLGQDLCIIIIEGEDAITLTVVVGDDIAGLTILQIIGHDGLLHVDDDGTALRQVINDLDDEFLSPAESTSEGVGL